MYCHASTGSGPLALRDRTPHTKLSERFMQRFYLCIMHNDALVTQHTADDTGSNHQSMNIITGTENTVIMK